MQLSDDQHSFARSLRRRQTNAESLIWYHLRGRRFMNLRFRRQHPIGPYFADFACLDLQLVIELDGGQHETTAGRANDETRTAHLVERGYTVLRFWDNDVLRAPIVILGAIADTVHALRRTERNVRQAVAKRDREEAPSPDLSVDLSRVRERFRR